MRSGEVGDVDDVDSTDDENSTVVTVNIPRSGHGMYIVDLMPMCGDDRIRVELQREKDLAVIGSSAGRPEWGSGTQAAALAQTPGPRLSTPAVETAESPGEETRMIAEMIPESFSHVVLVTGSRSWNEAKSMLKVAGRRLGAHHLSRRLVGPGAAGFQRNQGGGRRRPGLPRGRGSGAVHGLPRPLPEARMPEAKPGAAHAGCTGALLTRHHPCRARV
jgi:hypothetical protein